MDKKNVIIILIIGLAIIAGAYFLVRPKDESSSFGQKPPGDRLSSRITEYSQRIEKGEATKVLKEVDRSISALNKEGSVDMKFYLNELRGDALVKLGNCSDAQKAYITAMEALKLPADKTAIKTGVGIIPETDKPAFTTRLNGKMTKAKACTK